MLCHLSPSLRYMTLLNKHRGLFFFLLMLPSQPTLISFLVGCTSQQSYSKVTSVLSYQTFRILCPIQKLLINIVVYHLFLVFLAYVL